MVTTSKQTKEQTFTLKGFIESCAQDKAEARQSETSRGYRTLLGHLTRFLNHRPVGFEVVTESMLIDFESYLWNLGCCRNTSSLYLRRLRALHVRAAERGISSPPGKAYRRVFMGDESTLNTPLSGEQLCLLRNATFTVQQQGLELARDLFLLSFYLRGIPFVDLAHLRHTDLRGGILYYRRSKTGKGTGIHLEPCAVEIINRYRNAPSEGSPYLLPILKQCSQDEDYRTYQSALRLYNKRLNILRHLLHIDQRLSSYTPRYSWANAARELGIEIAFISAALCHSSEKSTHHYVRTLSPDLLVQQNRRVIEATCLWKMQGKANKNRCLSATANRYKPQKKRQKEILVL